MLSIYFDKVLRLWQIVGSGSNTIVNVIVYILTISLMHAEHWKHQIIEPGNLILFWVLIFSTLTIFIFHWRSFK